MITVLRNLGNDLPFPFMGIRAMQERAAGRVVHSHVNIDGDGASLSCHGYIYLIIYL